MAIALLAIGCFGSDGTDGPPDPGAIPSASAETSDAADPRLGDIPLSDDDVAELRAGTPLEADSAADGVLTFGEYTDVVLEMVACYEAAGYLPAGGLRLTAYGTYHLVFEPAVGGGASALGDKEPCPGLARAVLKVWGQAKTNPVTGIRPSQEVFDAAHDLLWACAEESGIDLHGRPPGDEAFQAIFTGGTIQEKLAFQECQERVFEEYGLPNWAG